MTSGLVMPFDGCAPTIADDVFVAPGACVIGDVQLAASSSVWFGAVIRGDFHAIRIGESVNIQDNAVLHGACTIGDNVTIGHLALIHAATIGDNVVIGAKAAVFDGCEIGEGSVIALGAVVSPGTRVPPRSLLVGSPARALRLVTEDEFAANLAKNAKYREAAARYLLAQRG